MLSTIPRRTTRLLVASATRQLVVLGVACVPLGIVAALLEAMVLPVVAMAALGWIVFICVLVAAVDVARGRTITPAVAARRLPKLAPRAVVQASIATAPMLVAAGVFMVLGSVQPLVALALVPLGLVLVPLAIAAAMLAIVAVVHGDAAWVPVVALRTLHPRWWRLAGLVVAAAVPIAFAALPIMLVGALARILLGPLGMLGTGLMLASCVPFCAAVAVATWRALGGGVLTRSDEAPIAPTVETPAAPAAMVPTWQPGPTWQVELDPRHPWGTWVELPPAATQAAHTVGVIVEVAGAPMPRLLTCDAAGAWLEWPMPATSGSVLPITLGAGASYLQLQATAPVASQVRMTLATLVYAPSVAAA